MLGFLWGISLESGKEGSPGSEATTAQEQLRQGGENRRQVYKQWCLSVDRARQSANPVSFNTAIQWLSQQLAKFPLLGEKSFLVRYDVLAALYSVFGSDSGLELEHFKRAVVHLPPIDALRATAATSEDLQRTLQAVYTTTSSPTEDGPLSCTPSHRERFLEMFSQLPLPPSDTLRCLVAETLLADCRLRTETYLAAASLLMGSFGPDLHEDPLQQAKFMCYFDIIDGHAGTYHASALACDHLHNSLRQIRIFLEADEADTTFVKKLKQRLWITLNGLSERVPLPAGPKSPSQRDSVRLRSAVPPYPPRNNYMVAEIHAEWKQIRHRASMGFNYLPTSRSSLQYSLAEAKEVPRSPRYHPENATRSVEMSAAVALVESVWLQVDPVLNRLIYHQADHEEIMEEIFTSVAPGKLQLLGNRITWQIDMSAVRVHIGRLSGEFGSNMFRESNLRWDSVMGAKAAKDEPTLTLRYDDISQFTWGRVGNTAAFYLSVHTKQVIKFFPFYEAEITELVAAVSDLTGKEPIVEDAYIDVILRQKLEATRMLVLRELSQKERPWISHESKMSELLDVLNALLAEDRTQSIYDMERLFHSCRLSKEVTHQTIIILKRKWHETMSESERVKILGICERVLDRVVMHASDENFKSLNVWLQQIEAMLDPYRSPQSLKMLLVLRKRAEEIRTQPLMSLTQNQIQEQFDYLDEFSQFKEQYRPDDEDVAQLKRTSDF